MARYILILIRYRRVGVLPLFLLLAAGSSLAGTSATKSVTDWYQCYPVTATVTLTCSISGSGVSCTRVHTNNAYCGQNMASSSAAPENLVNVWFPSPTVGINYDYVCASSATARQYCWKIAYTVISGRNRSMSMSENRDNDFDGLDDANDTDDDNDGVVDTADAFPLDNTQAGDIDADGIDGFVDNCPANSNADQLNTDGDAQGNVCDSDDDNDGVVDAADKFPLNAAESLDTDLDGTGNNADPDDDNDGLPDAMDPLPLQAKFNRDANYKGSQVRDSNGVQ